ncbi:MAG: KEOPS complex subunit Cgi121 [Nitrososphaerales archaeon]|jgi:tRNA threonylcarbamoyladenosine modification (KEOPS) complex Cgi121 subunit
MKGVLAARARIESEDADGVLLSLRKRHRTIVIQLVRLRKVPESQAVQMIGQQTLRAAETGALLAAKPEVDLLLRLAGTTQISVAIKESGYRAKGELLLVAAGPARGLSRLRKDLVGDPVYELLEGETVSASGLGLVERAALLGTRS